MMDYEISVDGLISKGGATVADATKR